MYNTVNVLQVAYGSRYFKILTNISCGTWVQTGSPAVSEILAYAGFDWICADLEHSDIDWNTFTNIVRAVKRHGAVPMARVSENEALAIRKALDCGAMGIIVPMVKDAVDAKKAVMAAKYPPDGIRGFAFCHANEWGAEFDDYVRTANSSIIVIAMAETREAVENIDAILETEGINGIFIGPYDLSGSYGVPGQISHPAVTEAKEKILTACKKHGKLAGQHIVMPDSESISSAVRQGYDFLALGMDTVFVSEGSKNILRILRQETEGRK
jgi:2-keto-3-deoxy-L-rhamnonate aldolase RhmA